MLYNKYSITEDKHKKLTIWSRKFSNGQHLATLVATYVLIYARRAIQNRFVTKLISVRHSGFALGRGSLLGIAVAVCLDVALERRIRFFRKFYCSLKFKMEKFE